MKKLVKVTLIIVVLVMGLTFGLSVSAKDTKNIIVYEEISDLSELYNLAQKNEDIQPNNKKSEAVVFKNNEVDEETFKIKNYEIKQKIQVEVLDDNITATTYRTTNFFEIVGEGGGYPIGYNRSNYKSDWDGSIGVRAYSTIYYTETIISNISYFDLLKVYGGWQIIDFQIYVTNQSINVTQTGFPSGGLYKNYLSTPSISGLTFEYYVPNYWQPVNPEGYGLVGLVTSCTLVRGLGSWELVMTNHI